MTDHVIQIWTLIATVVIAIGTFGAAVAAAIAANISAKAANSWRDGLKRQRADECIAAMENCSAAIGRTISRKKSGLTLAHSGGSGLDEAWHQWTSLRTAIVVFAAYQNTSFDDFIADGTIIMEELNNVVSSPGYGPDSGDDVNNKFYLLKSRIFSGLRVLMRTAG